jgi:hypothetical protein
MISDSFVEFVEIIKGLNFETFFQGIGNLFEMGLFDLGVKLEALSLGTPFEGLASFMSEKMNDFGTFLHEISGPLGKAFDTLFSTISSFYNKTIDFVANKIFEGDVSKIIGEEFGDGVSKSLVEAVRRRARKSQATPAAEDVSLDLQISDDLMDIELAFEKTLRNMKDIVGDVLTLDGLELDMSAELADMFANVEESLNPTKRESLIQTIKDELKDIKQVGVIDAFKKRFNIGQDKKEVVNKEFVGAFTKGSVEANSLMLKANERGPQKEVEKNTKITAELLNELVRNGITLKDVGLAQ